MRNSQKFRTEILSFDSPPVEFSYEQHVLNPVIGRYLNYNTYLTSRMALWQVGRDKHGVMVIIVY